MMAGLDDSVVLGAIVVLAGGWLALWPRAVTSGSQDPDGNAIPLTPANVRWTRRLGIALLILGGIVIWAGSTGVKGAVDSVLF